MDNFISVLDAKQIVMSDFPAISKQGLERNVKQVYLASNAWFYVLSDFGIPKGLLFGLKSVLTNVGLVKTVGACRNVAETYLEDLADLQLHDDHFFRLRLTDPITVPIGQILDFYQDEVSQDLQESVKFSLQFLLFLERFTYDVEAVGEASITKFLKANAVCRRMENHWDLWPGDTVLQHVRYELSRVLTQRHWHFKIEDCGFSSGSYTEAMLKTPSDPALKSPLGKWKSLSAYRPNVYGVEYALPGGSWNIRLYRQPVLTLVPKTLDTRRVIAPEDIVVSFYAHGALEAFRKMLKNNGHMRFINERDQSINREFARIGSQSGEWATIDMSSASDTISKSLAAAVLPRWFWNVLLEYQSHSVTWREGKHYRCSPLYILFTSGNPMTWLFESVWFLCLARTAAALCGSRRPDGDVFAYGDDLIVKAEYYEATIEILTSFGHTVNTRKSYGTGRFRESCGGWYFSGTDVTPSFWPRHFVKPGKAYIAAALVDLQHKFYTEGWSNANAWAIRELDNVSPQMTHSSPFSGYSDIWDPECDEYYDTTYAHTTFVSEVAEHSKSLSGLACAVAYVMYLKEGPLYLSEEDEALGISTSRYEDLMHWSTGVLRQR